MPGLIRVSKRTRITQTLKPTEVLLLFHQCNLLTLIPRLMISMIVKTGSFVRKSPSMFTLIGLLEKSRQKELGPPSQDVLGGKCVETRISTLARACTTKTSMMFTGATAT